MTSAKALVQKWHESCGESIDPARRFSLGAVEDFAEWMLAAEALTAPMSETEALERAREAFLSMMADGSSEEEPDGDETGDCTRFIITTGHSQLDDLMDALGIPPARYMERTVQRLDRALDAPSHAPEPLPVKDEDAELEARAKVLWEEAEIRRLSSVWTTPTRFEGEVREHYLTAARLEEKRHG